MVGSKIKEITLASVLTCILLVQKIALASIPNVTLTVFLMILYAKKLGFVRSTIIILAYIILDNLIMGSLSLIYTPFMILGWMVIPILTCTLFKKINHPLPLSLLGFGCSFIYCWVYLIPNVMLYHIDVIYYLADDLLFEIILAVSSFVSTIILYRPLSKVFDTYLINSKY